MNTAKCRDIAKQVSSGQLETEILRTKQNREVHRVQLPGGVSVIVKLWKRPGVRGALSRWAGTNCGYREWRLLTVLHEHGVNVVKPYAYCHLKESGIKHNEALVMGDLGCCKNGLDHVKSVLAMAESNALLDFENSVITIVRHMVDINVFDLDCSLENFLVNPLGAVFKTDLENARQTVLRAPYCYGIMLGTLAGTFAFAVQPAMDIADQFLIRLLDVLRPSKQVLRTAQAKIDAMMYSQREKCGIETSCTINRPVGHRLRSSTWRGSGP